MRWLLWFLLVPQSFLFAGYLQDLGVPPIDMAVVAALFLAWFADRRALPFLLLGVAVGRALVDEASLPVHILVIGVPVALMLPLRALFVAHRWLWQAVGAALLAIAVPKLAGVCGRIFDEPSNSALLQGWNVVWSAVLVPPVLLLALRLPPFRQFCEVEGPSLEAS